MNPRDCLHSFPDMSCAYCQWQIAKACVVVLQTTVDGFRELYCAAEAELDIAKSNLDLSGNRQTQMANQIFDLALHVLGLNEQVRTLTDRVEGLEAAIVNCFNTAESNEPMDRLYAMLSPDQRGEAKES